jgi:hypothetical protein
MRGSDATEKAPLRRIVVAFDSTGRAAPAGTISLKLAAELRAELHGLFIEDLELLRAAELPFTRMISISGSPAVAVTVESMAQTIRIAAERIRADLSARAREAKVDWSFDVRRDVFPRALLEAAGSADLLLAGPRQPRPGRRSAGPGTMEPGPLGPLIVLLDEETGQQTVRVACEVRRILDVSMIVCASTSDLLRAAERQYQVNQVAGVLFQFLQAGQDVSDVLELARRERPRLVLVRRGHPLLSESALRLLIERLQCPIGIVS